jgi:penicillin-insensitive murein endopeptidase
LRIVPAYAGGDVRWGLEALTGMIDRAARQVRRQHPEAVLSVGHLSRRGGGEIDRHASHESGRDADIGFYIKDNGGKPVLPDRLIPFVADGTSPHMPGAHFDDARNWLLVTAFVSDPVAQVTHIFVAAPLRARLLAYAEKIGAPQNLRNRAAELMAQPRGSLPHDDHFHVRIGCPHGMSTCVENPEPHTLAKKSGRAPATAHAASTTHAGGGHPSAGHAAGGSKATTPPARKADESQTAKAAPQQVSRPAAKPEEDDSIPTLGPVAPGLDSVIVATPLERPQPAAPAPAALPASEPPALTADVDGVGN